MHREILSRDHPLKDLNNRPYFFKRGDTGFGVNRHAETNFMLGRFLAIITKSHCVRCVGPVSNAECVAATRPAWQSAAETHKRTSSTIQPDPFWSPPPGPLLPIRTTQPNRPHLRRRVRRYDQLPRRCRPLLLVRCQPRIRPRLVERRIFIRARRYGAPPVSCPRSYPCSASSTSSEPEHPLPLREPFPSLLLLLLVRNSSRIRSMAACPSSRK